MSDTPLRLLVLGATGGTGRQVVTQALQRGHSVIAVSRDPERLGINHLALSRRAADLTTDADLLSALLIGHHAVISCLGRGPSLKSEQLMEIATRNLIPAMERYGPRRLVFLSAFGVGDSLTMASLPLRLVFRTVLANIYADKARAESTVQGSALEWTVLRPTKLTDAPANGHAQVTDRLPRSAKATMTRADLASAILDTVVDQGTVGRTLVVSA